jgi:Arc/MetJ-type ribon-helix-helix transcriptional regulator
MITYNLTSSEDKKLLALREIIDDAFNSGEPETFDIVDFLQELRSEDAQE